MRSGVREPNTVHTTADTSAVDPRRSASAYCEKGDESASGAETGIATTPLRLAAALRHRSWNPEKGHVPHR
jgi:hypothetical protein